MTNFESLLPVGIGIAAAVAILIVLIPVVILAEGAFILLGAKIAGIEGRSYGRALLVVLVSMIPSLLAAVVLDSVPVFGPIFSFIAGFVIAAAVMVPLFKTTFGKAILASLLSWVFSLPVFGVIALVVVAALAAMGMLAGAACGM